MWAFTVITLVCIGGVMCYTMECSLKEDEECGMKSWPSEIPKTTEDLDDLCSELKSLMKCLYEVSKECEDNEERTEYLKNVADFLEESCLPDSQIHKAISSNLECLDSAMQTVVHECYMKEEENNEIESLYQQYTKTDDSEDRGQCIMGMFIDTCIAVQVHKNCGEEAAEATFNILLNVDYKLFLCGEELLDEIHAIIPLFMAVADVEEDVENALNKKK